MRTALCLYSIVGWDHITQGLVQLGFALMESFGPRATFGKSATHNISTLKPKLLTPPQASCLLGIRILQETFRVHEPARVEIVERLLNSIVTRATAPVSHYLGNWHCASIKSWCFWYLLMFKGFFSILNVHNYIEIYYCHCRYSVCRKSAVESFNDFFCCSNFHCFFYLGVSHYALSFVK